jgi:hypothetical protein
MSVINSFAATARLALLALSLLVVPSQSLRGQAFVLDTSGVPQQYRVYFNDVAVDLNNRIQDYSNELPKSLLYQLDKLYIVCLVAPAPAGVLGFAGPNGTVTHRSTDNQLRIRRKVVPVHGTITINSNEIDAMIADDLLDSTIGHEILHVFGFGSLWQQNRLVGPISEFGPQPVNNLPTSVGLFQYFGGKYAIEQYRRETNNRFAGFVPIEQSGGGGTALSHWADEGPFFNQTFTPAFTKEIMTGFACDSADGTGNDLVCPPTFFSMTTEGALADLGYAMYKINPNQTKPPTGLAGRDWPKIVGSRRNPFADPNDPFNGGGNLSFRFTNITKVYKRSAQVTAGVDGKDPVIRPEDPFNLRNHNWANK